MLQVKLEALVRLKNCGVLKNRNGHFSIFAIATFAKSTRKICIGYFGLDARKISKHSLRSS